jgi:hypothetical protein
MRTFRGGAWRGSDLHSLIWSQGMHPPADTHRAVARAWRSPFTGTVRLSGTVSDQRKCAETDGIRIAVFKNATRLWGWTTIADGSEPIDLDVTTTVAKDDAVRLVVHPGAASGCDQTATDLTVVATW